VRNQVSAGEGRIITMRAGDLRAAHLSRIMPMVPLALAPRVMRTVRLPLPSAVGRARVDVRNELVEILKRLLQVMSLSKTWNRSLMDFSLESVLGNRGQPF
jgi:hypothetical protein